MKYFPAEKSANAVLISLNNKRTALFSDTVNYKGGTD